MTVLTPDQIAGYARAAGFTGEGLVKAVAVALAESGGRTDAVGTNTDRWRSKDRGLWQINDHWHPDVSTAEAFNPSTAAAHAFRISKGGKDWSPWSTWPVAASGQMGRARLAANKAGSTPAPNVRPAGNDLDNPLLLAVPPLALADILGAEVANPLDAAKAAIGLAVKTGAWVSDSHNWFRVALVIGGGVATLAGIAMLARSGAAGETAQGIAAVPGKIAGAAVGAGTAVATGGASLAAKAATAAK